jgi:hypothetical protein
LYELVTWWCITDYVFYVIAHGNINSNSKSKGNKQRGSSRPLDLPLKAITVPILWARSAIIFRNLPRRNLPSRFLPKTLSILR